MRRAVARAWHTSGGALRARRAASAKDRRAISPSGESQATSLMPATSTGGRTAAASTSACLAFGGCTSADIDRPRDPVTRKRRGAAAALLAAAPLRSAGLHLDLLLLLLRLCRFRQGQRQHAFGEVGTDLVALDA